MRKALAVFFVVAATIGGSAATALADSTDHPNHFHCPLASPGYGGGAPDCGVGGGNA